MTRLFVIGFTGVAMTLLLGTQSACKKEQAEEAKPAAPAAAAPAEPAPAPDKPET